MKHALNVSTPVVILQAPRHGALGIARSLGRLGAPVYIVEGNPLAAPRFSRYVRGRFAWDFESVDDEQRVNLLVEAGHKIGRRSILIPTTDNSAIFVATHAERLREWFEFQDMPLNLVQSLASKKDMFYLAKRLGIPSPECLFPESRTDVVEFLDRAAFPIMLKGIDGVRLERFTGKRMFLVESARELLEIYDRIPVSERLNVMLQEYIPGGTETCWMFNGYFNRGSDCLIGFSGQKIRQYPVYTGATSLGICRRNGDVIALTQKFMKAVGYQGILDIGYRFDRRDGQYKVIDVNPRVGATFRLFVGRNGMDVARALYLDLTGQCVESSEAPDGRKWVVEDQDLVSSVRYWRDGKLKLVDWAKSFRGVREGGCWALDDPLPFLGTILLDAAKAFERAPANPGLQAALALVPGD